MDFYEDGLEESLSYGSSLATYFSENLDFESDNVLTDGGKYDHLEDVPDGAGCTEIWEKLSDERDPLEER